MSAPEVTRRNVVAPWFRDVLEEAMVAIGFVIKQHDGSYTGELKTLTIQTPIEIRPILKKTNERQPDFRVYAANSLEIGSARKKIGQDSQKEYVALQFAIPEFGPRKLSANLGPAAGQVDTNVFAILWNPESSSD